MKRLPFKNFEVSPTYIKREEGLLEREVARLFLKRCVILYYKMTTEKSQLPSVTPPAMDSCRKKKSEEATFLEDVKDHIDEFIHASMDEHKTCFKKTISKMFGMSKVVAERNAAENKGIESSLPLRTVVSD